MTANLYQGAGNYMEKVGQISKGRMPGPVMVPPMQAMSQGSEGPVMSDLQNMMENERKQHEQNYIYENGHNDHGLGQ